MKLILKAFVRKSINFVDYISKHPKMPEDISLSSCHHNFKLIDDLFKSARNFYF